MIYIAQDVIYYTYELQKKILSDITAVTLKLDT